jgi:hypothetical protein
VQDRRVNTDIIHGTIEKLTESEVMELGAVIEPSSTEGAAGS